MACMVCFFSSCTAAHGNGRWFYWECGNRLLSACETPQVQHIRDQGSSASPRYDTTICIHFRNVLIREEGGFLTHKVYIEVSLREHVRFPPPEESDNFMYSFCSIHPSIERAWNMTIPGFSTEEQHAAPIKKSAATESHKQVCMVTFKLCLSPKIIFFF